MPASDLTTLDAVKQWAIQSQGSAPSTMDDLIQSYISQASAAMLDYLNRGSCLVHTVSELRDGTGNQRMMLRQYPVVGVTQLLVNGTPIQASNPAPVQSGYILAPANPEPPGSAQSLSLVGYRFTRGMMNVSITYKAGYQVQGEVQTIPDDGTNRVTALQPYGRWAQDDGVTYADGTPLTPVKDNPQVGQYVPPTPFNMTGKTTYYQFSGNDANKGVVLTYSFIPQVLDNACMQWVAEGISYRGRIGQKSKSLGGQEVVAFMITDMPLIVKTMIAPYHKVAPM